MRGLVQRVTEARVIVDGAVVGEIGVGLAASSSASRTPTLRTDGCGAIAQATRSCRLRVLRDEKSVTDVAEAGVLVVSQFTLYGDARKGRRPTWAAAAPADQAQPLVGVVVDEAPGSLGVGGGDWNLSGRYAR